MRALNEQTEQNGQDRMEEVNRIKTGQNRDSKGDGG